MNGGSRGSGWFRGSGWRRCWSASPFWDATWVVILMTPKLWGHRGGNLSNLVRKCHSLWRWRRQFEECPGDERTSANGKRHWITTRISVQCGRRQSLAEAASGSVMSPDHEETHVNGCRFGSSAVRRCLTGWKNSRPPLAYSSPSATVNTVSLSHTHAHTQTHTWHILCTTVMWWNDNGWKVRRDSTSSGKLATPCQWLGPEARVASTYLHLQL